MKPSTRRGFLALTGSGVAAVAVAPAALAAGSPDRASTSPSPQAEGSMVAYVHNAATGEVAVMVGEREVVVHDRALVAALARHLLA